MKLIIGFLSVMFVMALLIPFAPNSAPRPIRSDQDAVIPEPFIGTWRDHRIPDDIYIFREDGTGLSGRRGWRREIAWGIVNGEIFTGRSRAEYRLDGNTLTVHIRGTAATRSTSIFEFYSEDTDLYEQEQFFTIINLGLIMLFGIPLVICIWRIIWKKKNPNPLEDNPLANRRL